MARGTVFGIGKGHVVSKIAKEDRRAKPSHMKGRLCSRTNKIRALIRSVVGWAPYEVRMRELLRTG